MLYKEIVKKISVSAEKKLKQKKYLKEGSFEVVDQGQSLIGGYSNDSSLVVKCDLPVIVFGDHTKCVKFIDFPFIAGADGVKVLRTKDGVDSKYLYYYTLLLTKKMVDKGYARHYQFLEKMEVNVPSLTEQKRIVNKIEKLFSELDSAVETLKKTKEQLAVYRQSVLKSAFDGVYTKEWREHNDHSVADYKKELYKKRCEAGNTSKYQLMEKISLPTIPNGWEWIFVGDILTSPEYGTSKKSLKVGRVPVLRMGNMKKGLIDWEDLVYSNDDADNIKYRLTDQDVLFNRTNSPEHVGKTSIFKGNREAIFAGYIIRMNQLPDINAQYLTYYMNSHVARKYSNLVKTDGVNQSNINSKKLMSYPFPLCTRAEQDKVVTEIEARLSVCENIEKTVNDALAQAEAMRQSILKKAFEGEL